MHHSGRRALHKVNLPQGSLRWGNFLFLSCMNRYYCGVIGFVRGWVLFAAAEAVGTPRGGGGRAWIPGFLEVEC